MASIRREVLINAPAEDIWDALRDLGALATRLVPGFVVDCKLEGNARMVSFANGVVAREVIVDVNDQDRRLVWSATGERLAHHNASAQVISVGAHASRVVWIADLLPDEMAPAVAAMMDHGMAAMKKTLESQAA